MTKPQILLVDDAASVREAIAHMLAPRYAVLTAHDATEAFHVLRSRDGLPVVISEFAMPGASGVELLEHVQAEWPGTIGILLAGAKDLAVAAEAVREGRVFRFLAKPCSYERLIEAIESGLESHRRSEERAVENARLVFTKESLAGLNELFAERIDRQSQALKRLSRLASELDGAASLERIARLGAEAAFDLLGGRGVHVQLWDDAPARSPAEASTGPEMSADMHRIGVRAGAADIGEIVVEAGRFAGRELEGQELLLLEALSSAISVAAHHELRRASSARAYDSVILALARLAEARDNGTGQHLERVAAYCRLIAEGLRSEGGFAEQLDDGWIEDLVRSSPLHDIGKVGIPDSILLKPARLTEEEWRVMRTHGELGAATLDEVMKDCGRHRILEMGRDICRYHHEKWDGTGYPRGLAGDAIPLEARILALADVYDALTSERPYKHAWMHDEAVEWIRSRTATHFDPRIVGSFLAHAPRFDSIRARLADAPAPRSIEESDIALRTR